MATQSKSWVLLVVCGADTISRPCRSAQRACLSTQGQLRHDNSFPITVLGSAVHREPGRQCARSHASAGKAIAEDAEEDGGPRLKCLLLKGQPPYKDARMFADKVEIRK